MRLREDLLNDRAIALAGPVQAGLSESLSSLGARVESLPPAGSDEAELENWARERAPLHGLVYDASPSFGAGGQAGLAAAIDLAWVAARAVAVGALIQGPDPAKVVFVAPGANAGPLAAAAAAALENLARTLSVEWARYAITATAIVPSGAATAAQLAELVCFLVSPAGDYFSGCRFEVGRVVAGG